MKTKTDTSGNTAVVMTAAEKGKLAGSREVLEQYGYFIRREQDMHNRVLEAVDLLDQLLEETQEVTPEPVEANRG